MEIGINRYENYKETGIEWIAKIPEHRIIANPKTLIYLCAMPSPIAISPNIQSGEPVFSSTRVPVKFSGSSTVSRRGRCGAEEDDDLNLNGSSTVS